MSFSIEKHKDKSYLIFLLAFIFLATFCIMAIPHTFSTWFDGGWDWHIVTWIFGTWFKYNRFDADLNEGGYLSEFDTFTTAIPILVLTSLVVIIISVFFTGRNRRRSFTIQRVAGIVMNLSSIAGFVGVMLFYQYTTYQTMDPYMKLSAGFYIAAIYFPIIFLASFKAMFISVQLPKLVQNKEPPEQEGELIPLDQKMAKNKQFFRYIKQIESEKDSG